MLQGWVDSCGVRGNTHIWRNACCVVRWSAARKARGVERREMEKGRSVMIHIGGIAGGGLCTLAVNKLPQESLCLSVWKVKPLSI